MRQFHNAVELRRFPSPQARLGELIAAQQVTSGQLAGMSAPVDLPRPLLQAARMHQEEAEAAILAEWSEWAPKNLPNKPQPTSLDARMFFVHLQTEKPELLEFRTSADQWQVVLELLRRVALVRD